MKTPIKSLVIAVSLLIPALARAEDPRFALGGGVSAFSTEIQGDLEFHRQAAIEAGVGAPFGGDLTWSLGGRYYFTPKHVAPYLGVLYADEQWNQEYVYEGHRVWIDHGAAHLLGPTIGLRIRQRRMPGLGGFVQLELFQDMDHPGPWVPSLGAGIAWWF